MSKCYVKKKHINIYFLKKIECKHLKTYKK